MAWLCTSRRRLFAVVFVTAMMTVCAEAAGETTFKDFHPIQIMEQVKECYIIKALSDLKKSEAPQTASLTTRLFSMLFPSANPAINALLATAYISGPPNFLLALCPPNIDPASLTIMVAFAVGGLLGDTLFHLLPEIFLGEDEPLEVKLVMLEPNRNLLLGVAILSGIVAFMAMDKALRIATGGSGHSHDHTHTPTPTVKETANGTTTSARKQANANGSLRKRKASPSPSPPKSTQVVPANPSVKLAGLLNLIADFTHNITDGLALSSSFYASPALGATTTMAVFFHEIPHEVGDFALLIQSGFSKRKAMAAQFITAVGAFLGTAIGIVVNEYGKDTEREFLNSKEGPDRLQMQGGQGIWGTSLGWGDMLLPFTAGTFLYVGTVAVIPELLETGPNKREELMKTAKQFAAMFVGAAIMLAISWS